MFYRDGSDKPASKHLVPIVDLINHSDKPNAFRWGALLQLAPSTRAAAAHVPALS